MKLRTVSIGLGFLLFVALFYIHVLSVHAATFSCAIRTSCNANETILLRMNSSESGAAPNNSHAQLPNSTAGAYPYSVCCWTDSFRTMSNSCIGNGVAVVKLYNDTNSHVENGSGTQYQYDACLNVTAGRVACEYPNSACSAGYSSVASIASSTPTDANLTNAHVADFGFYTRKVCCQVGGQNPPSVAYVNISPNGTATTRQDLECQNGSLSDPDGDTVSLSYNWHRNGTSITVLNMPMDYDGVNTTHDFSGFNNHGFVNDGVTFLPTDGYVGGAFSFNGTGGYINVTKSPSVNNLQNFTWSAWVNPRSLGEGNRGTILSKVPASDGGQKYMEVNNDIGNNFEVFVQHSISGCSTSSSLNSVAFNTWQFVAMTYNASSKNLTLYINGTYVNSCVATGTLQNDNAMDILIGNKPDDDAAFNGSIDEVTIFNRSLTSMEIKTLYNTNNRFFNGTELRRNDGWNCSITPIDSSGLNGTTKYSNMTVIGGSAPLAPNLTYPVNNNQSVFERFVNFTWTAATEPDGDQINYTLNLTVTPGACSVATTQTNLQTTNYTFGELCTDQLYNWTVQACDMDGCSTLSTKFNFSVASVVGVKLIVNLTQFGSFGPLQSKATDVDNIEPFIVNNTGNVRINLTLNGTNSPFSTVGLPTTSYQYKAAENRSNAYNISGSQSTYTPIDSAYKNLLRQLNYSDKANGYASPINSTARIDINVTIPVSEPPGNKQGNMTIQAVAG